MGSESDSLVTFMNCKKTKLFLSLIWLHILTPLLAIKGKVSKQPPERREKIEQKEVAVLAVLGDGMEPIPTTAKKSVIFFTQGAPKVCKKKDDIITLLL
jgi:hypothetical protein